MIYKFVPPARIDILRNKTLRATRFFDLNDPFECLFAGNPMPGEEDDAEADGYKAEKAAVDVLLQSTFGNLGLLCFAESYDCIPMWAHYAANHTGFVIGFDEHSAMFETRCEYTDPLYGVRKDITEPGFGSLRRVDYVDDIVAVDHGDSVSYDIFFRKGRDWSYERELRIFRSRSDCRHVNDIWLLDVPPNTIREVILGVNADFHLREQMADLAKTTENSQIKFKTARVNPRRYGLILDDP